MSSNDNRSSAGLDVPVGERGAHRFGDVGLRELAGGQVHGQLDVVLGARGPVPSGDGAAGAGQHPFADGDDQSGPFGGLQELAGEQQPAFRMVPPDQGFDADRATGRDVDDRLVVEDELVARQGVRQVLLEVHPITSRAPHLVVEELHLARRAMCLGVVHGRVGLAQERFCGNDLVRDASHADAHRDVEHFALESEGLVEHGADPLRDPVERDQVADVFAQDHELVAAEARERVGRAHDPAQPTRDLDQAARHRS